MKKTILAAIISAILTRPAYAYNVTHNFTVFLGPFNASNTVFNYNITPQSYSVKSTVDTYGFFGSVYPFTAEYLTTGKIQKQVLSTTSYKSYSQSRFNTRHKEMFYNKDGKPTYRISSKNKIAGKKIEILPPPDDIHTTDLQTVLADMIVQYTKMKFCNSRMHVFDGKKRFDVIFSDEGTEDIEANEFSRFSGKAVKCSFYADDLGQKHDDLIFSLTPENPIYFWILEDAETKLPFIARIENQSTPLGKLVVYTNKIEIKD